MPERASVHWSCHIAPPLPARTDDALAPDHLVAAATFNLVTNEASHQTKQRCLRAFATIRYQCMSQEEKLFGRNRLVATRVIPQYQVPLGFWLSLSRLEEDLKD